MRRRTYRKSETAGVVSHRAQKRIILDFMGVPLRSQPEKAGELDELIRTAQITQPEQYKQAMDIVVNKKFPNGGITPPTPREVSYAEWERIAREALDEAMDGAFEAAQTKAFQIVDGAQASFNDHVTAKAAQLSKQVEYAIAAAAKKYERIEVKVGSAKPVQLNEIVPEEFPRLLKLAAARKNILMVGPSGCGKTYVAALLAKALGLRYSSQSCSVGVSESVFTGWLIPIDNGNFVHVPSEFITLYEEGGVFLIDEIDASDPNVLVFINQALANDHFFLPQRHEKPKVTKHKDFIAIGAANTFGTGADAIYTARQALDEATRDRFRIGTILMDYSPCVEEKLVNSEVLAWGRSLRAVINRHKLRKILSTRLMIDATDMIRDQDWTMADVKQAYFTDWSAEEKRIVAGEMGGAL